jgi:hypothetical protein
LQIAGDSRHVANPIAPTTNMITLVPQKSRLPRALVVWVLGLIAVALIGGSLAMDLSGQSSADGYVIARWSLEGLRFYLWLEGGLLAAIVAALGAHIISVGFDVARGGPANLLGISRPGPPRVPRQTGYIFVVLGSALVALSLTTLVLLNSCRYMRLA